MRTYRLMITAAIAIAAAIAPALAAAAGSAGGATQLDIGGALAGLATVILSAVVPLAKRAISELGSLVGLKRGGEAMGQLKEYVERGMQVAERQAGESLRESGLTVDLHSQIAAQSVEYVLGQAPKLLGDAGVTEDQLRTWVGEMVTERSQGEGSTGKGSGSQPAASAG